MNALRPCTDCGRHVRTDSPACPFCGADVAPEPERSCGAAIARGLTRAAIFAGAALLMPACGGSEVEREQVEETSGGGGGETLGTQTTDTATDGSGTGTDATDTQPDETTVAPPYGAAPADDPLRTV